MDIIRIFFLDKIKEKHIVDKILKEYKEDNGDVEISHLLMNYYLTDMNYEEYKRDEKKIIEKYERKNKAL